MLMGDELKDGEAKTLNELLDEITNLRSEIKEIDEKRSNLKNKLNNCESITLYKLEEQGIDRIGNESCTVSIRKDIVPNVEDWDQVHMYVKKTGQFELLHRRMSSTAYKELQSMGSNVPGVKPRELIRINFRSK